jgi:hypothetical protein
MQAQTIFHVRPLNRYKGARYGSENHASLRSYAAWALWRLPTKAGKAIATLLFAAAIATSGGIAQAKDHPDHGMVDGGRAACTPGEVYCTDENTLVTCNENGHLKRQKCDVVCKEKFGPHSQSNGCKADAPDPCQCDDEPGMLEGEPVRIAPEDLK